MALKSSREGLRKELVDYLGNIIIDENLKQNIINSIDDVFINNEELSTSVNELNNKIRDETSARESSDTTLQENINVETSARESSDTTLQENINAETSARESADSNLESNKANKSDVLSLEEIQASTDLSGMIASANSVKNILKTVAYVFSSTIRTLTLSKGGNYLIITALPTDSGYFGLFYLFSNYFFTLYNNTANVTYDNETATLTIPAYFITYVLEVIHD